MPNNSPATEGFWTFSITDLITLLAVLVALATPFILIALQAIYEYLIRRRNRTNIAAYLISELAVIRLEIEAAKNVLAEAKEGIRKEDDGPGYYLIPISRRLSTYSEWIYLLPKSISGPISISIAIFNVYNHRLKHFGVPRDEGEVEYYIKRIKTGHEYLKLAYSALNEKYPSTRAALDLEKKEGDGK